MKNIIFDLGSVLIKNRAISVLDKLDIDDNTYNELQRFFNDYLELDLGNISLEEKYNNCNFSNEINNKYKDYILHYYEYREYNMELIDIINKLKNNNYNVYVLSDNNQESFDYYKKNALFKNIDGWTASCEHGAIKEDGKLFEVFLNKYKLDPKECYLIDDKETNIIEANKYGIKGFIFDENKDISLLINDMKDNGINI